MKYSLRSEPWWNAERRARSALRAPQPEGCGGWLRVFRRSAFLVVLSLPLVAQGTDREATGTHRRHSLAKIGVEGERFLQLKQQLGCGSHRENETVCHLSPWGEGARRAG